MKRLFRRQNLLFISFFITFVDQITKIVSINILKTGNPIIIIPYFLKLNVVKNTGAAFSLLKDSTIFLSLLSLLVSIFLVFWIWNKMPVSVYKGLGLAFLLGGTVGNGIDRFRLGYVIDFIELIPIQFPIFNIADTSINIAIIFLLADTFKQNRQENEDKFNLNK